jgi:hypothetical protein
MQGSDDNSDVRHQPHHEPVEEVGGNDTTTATSTTNEHPDLDNDEEIRLDYELQILRKMRLSFVSTLNMLEAARDDLNHSIPHDVDELRRASERIRAALATLREHVP